MAPCTILWLGWRVLYRSTWRGCDSTQIRAQQKLTGIDKVAATEPVIVRAPGQVDGAQRDLGSGLVSDTIGNQKSHGGDDQAVYAYAREDLDAWEIQLERELTNGMFGENLTTSGVDITGARIGERWHVGSDGLLLEVSAPRTPCRTFAEFLHLTSEPVDQDVHPGWEAWRLPEGDLAGHGPCRRCDHDRLSTRA